jgi:hypothetical protein
LNFVRTPTQSTACEIQVFKSGEALEQQTDDCIAFGILLGQSLSAYGERLAKRYGEGAPKISSQGLDKGDDLIPDMSAYADWARFV